MLLHSVFGDPKLACNATSRAFPRDSSTSTPASRGVSPVARLKTSTRSERVIGSTVTAIDAVIPWLLVCNLAAFKATHAPPPACALDMAADVSMPSSAASSWAATFSAAAGTGDSPGLVGNNRRKLCSAAGVSRRHSGRRQTTPTPEPSTADRRPVRTSGPPERAAPR